MSRSLACFALLLVLVALGDSAHAQGFLLDRDPRPGLAHDASFVERADLPSARAGALSVVLASSYALDPLIVSADADGRAGAIVGPQLVTRTAIAVAAHPRLWLGVGGDVGVQSGDEPRGSDGQRISPASFGVGAPHLDLRAGLHHAERLHVAVAARVHLPVGSPGAFLADHGLSGSLRLLVTAPLGPRWSLAGSAGAVLRPRAALEGLEVGSDLTYAVALQVRTSATLAFRLEAFGSSTLHRLFEGRQSPLEVAAGSAWENQRFSVAFSLGTGLTSAYGAPTLRATLRLAYRRAPTRP